MRGVLLAYATSLADPRGTSSLVAAAEWLEETLLGPVATGVALIAVAGVGYLTLSGRLHLRRGAEVLLGCFILFGAAAIAAGLREISSESASEVITAGPIPIAPYALPASQPTSTPRNPGYDPYAGASLPPR